MDGEPTESEKLGWRLICRALPLSILKEKLKPRAVLGYVNNPDWVPDEQATLQHEPCGYWPSPSTGAGDGTGVGDGGGSISWPPMGGGGWPHPGSWSNPPGGLGYPTPPTPASNLGGDGDDDFLAAYMVVSDPYNLTPAQHALMTPAPWCSGGLYLNNSAGDISERFSPKFISGYSNRATAVVIASVADNLPPDRFIVQSTEEFNVSMFPDYNSITNINESDYGHCGGTPNYATYDVLLYGTMFCIDDFVFITARDWLSGASAERSVRTGYTYMYISGLSYEPVIPFDYGGGFVTVLAHRESSAVYAGGIKVGAEISIDETSFSQEYQVTRAITRIIDLPKYEGRWTGIDIEDTAACGGGTSGYTLIGAGGAYGDSYLPALRFDNRVEDYPKAIWDPDGTIRSETIAVSYTAVEIIFTVDESRDTYVWNIAAHDVNGGGCIYITEVDEYLSVARTTIKETSTWEIHIKDAGIDLTIPIGTYHNNRAYTLLSDTPWISFGASDEGGRYLDNETIYSFSTPNGVYYTWAYTTYDAATWGDARRVFGVCTPEGEVFTSQEFLEEDDYTFRLTLDDISFELTLAFVIVKSEVAEYRDPLVTYI